MRLKRTLAIVLSMLLLLTGCLSACRPKTPDTGEDTTGEPQEGTVGGSETTDPGNEETTAEGEVTEPVEPVLVGPYADTLMLSNRLADGVQAYYANAARSVYRIENKSMTLDYSLTDTSKQVAALKNSKGQAYLTDTMDVFITMQDGKTYLASESTASPYTNIYRMSYYYYDTHIMGQNFMGGAAITKEMPFTINKATVKTNQVSGFNVTKDGVIVFTGDGNDPYVYTAQNKTKEGLCFPAAEYNAVQFSMKATTTWGELYFIAGSRSGHSSDQMVKFDLIGDGEWHTYTVVLTTVPDYTDMVTSLRFDVGNGGHQVELKDIKAVKLDTTAPAIQLDRTFHTYSDKMNQVLHFVASERIEGIAGMGYVTNIPADTVDKLIVKDAKGTHDSLDGVDFATVEYAGFDIKGVGVLGFILLPHENSGKLEISLTDGVYTVTQTACPSGGIMEANPNSTADDFYMGHRLYTDESHDFTTFLKEAEIERHPLETVSGDSYKGYDVLRGAYKFGIGSTGFNEPFFTEWNRHFSAGVTVEGGDDRTIYVYTYATGGCGENAVILGQNDLLLPIPVMICKNFKGENEEPVFDPGDPSYSETYFPISVKAGETTKLTVLNLYMNWGTMPLKQLSSIQFFWPYYHLSLGTTETSCISPLYGARDLWTLPDFRSLSMPYWFELPEGQGYSNQPQHTHGGFQYFLQYTDAEGNYSATENYHNDIISSGPVYTDVRMDYVSDDGRIKVTYNHVELPETDELRAYYEIHYEILEDITIGNFAEDFSFYSLEGYAGAYQKIGYLDENNQIVQGRVNSRANAEILKLGDKNPYLALYDLNATDPSWTTNNVNLGFVIYDSSFIIGGQACNAGFVAVGKNSKYSLSLDLDNVTLKKGDTMTLCLIISPWGFYNSTDDSNMQAIRENTCLNGLKLTVQDGEAMESVYVPKIKSLNGSSVEFTVSGGTNNKAVRVYGFDKLTAPVIYEKIGGEWVELTVNSSDSPDKKGNSHSYDGYAVYYDRNGTYSYAFAFSMDGVESRTFKVVADTEFAGWNDEGEDVEQNELKVYADAEALQLAAQSGATGMGKVELAEDKSYVRIYGYGDGAGESFFTVFKNSDMSPTGQYLIVKCRIPTTNKKATEFEFFTSTTHSGAHAGDSFYVRGVPADGEWHYLVMDLTAQNLPTFEVDSAGSYTALHLRFDVFNGTTANTEYVDIAYVAMAESMTAICDFQKTGLGEIYEGSAKVDTINFATGGSSTAPSDTNTPASLVDPASGWTVSSIRYASMIDFINGKGDGDGAYNSRGSNTDKGLDRIEFKDTTVDGGKLALAGWAVAEGGIDKYLWSADGGKTWQECTLYNRNGYNPVGGNAGILAAGNQFFQSSGYDVAEHPDKIIFQGIEGSPSGVCADLAAYAGQTLDVIFALVPAADTDGLCVMAVIEGVIVEG